MKMSKIVAALGLLAVTSIAGAAVDLVRDTEGVFTGQGFVGKGDVQLAFGWNNQQLQLNARNVAFAYSASVFYQATCVWVTGEGTRGEKTHTIRRTVTSQVAGKVAYDLRSRNQITGFELTGFDGIPTVTGKVPAVGETCPGQGTDGEWTDVSETGASESFMVTFGNSSVDLLLAPPI